MVTEVKDFGREIPADRLVRLRENSAETGVGLAGMRERLNELNGKLEIESEGQGTTLRATVPLSAVSRLADLEKRREVVHLQTSPDGGNSQIGLVSE